MKPNRYPLVVFDFDGTLADSFPWFSGILNEVADRYRFRRIAADEAERLRGLDARAIIRHLGIPAWKVPLVTRHMHGLARRDIGLIRTFPDVPAMLTSLVENDIRLGIVSSNREANIRCVLGDAQASQFAHYACGASLFGKARRLRGLIREAGFAPGDAIYIGDEIRDAAAARAAGCAFGAVAWGYTRPDALKRCEPALTFADPGRITAALAPAIPTSKATIMA